jgi:small acid-soluble spore protein A (major alpha-type SASP)
MDEDICFCRIYTHKEVKTMSNNNNQLLVNGAEQALNQMKYEIANEFGVNLGADTTSRANGSVGGEITKRLVSMAEQQLGGQIR